jgi:hypothetical protein
LVDAPVLLKAAMSVAEMSRTAAATIVASIDERGFRRYWSEGGMEWRRRHRKDLHTSTTTGRTPRAIPADVLRLIAERDGWRCRYCGLRTVRKAALRVINQRFPAEFPLGAKDADRHAAALVLGFSPDHVVPWHLGGTNDPDNLVSSCGTCNYMKGSCTIEELNLEDPRGRPPAANEWDGLSIA